MRQYRESNYSILFGPVPSRRLGRSLGVDLVPPKTCTLDCVYCECGATTNQTIQRKEYVPSRSVLEELGRYLDASPELDYITFSGSGEPTLSSTLGKTISYLKANYPGYNVALLTNSTLLHDPQVRTEISACDLILPSLDAVSQDVFEKINRPIPGFDCSLVLQGLESLAKEFKGKLWIEVFIVGGINDTESELGLLKEALAGITPSRVQINTLDRPGTCSRIEPVPADRLCEIADFFLPLPVEIISRNSISYKFDLKGNLNAGAVISALKRRPSTIEDLAVISNTNINIVKDMIDEMVSRKQVAVENLSGKIFYRISV